MLVLTCRAGDTLIIELPTSKQATVAVPGLKGNQVRIIGTVAPS